MNIGRIWYLGATIQREDSHRSIFGVMQCGRGLPTFRTLRLPIFKADYGSSSFFRNVANGFQDYMT
jgi:hypothetical protein